MRSMPVTPEGNILHAPFALFDANAGQPYRNCSGVPHRSDLKASSCTPHAPNLGPAVARATAHAHLQPASHI